MKRRMNVSEFDGEASITPSERHIGEGGLRTPPAAIRRNRGKPGGRRAIRASGEQMGWLITATATNGMPARTTRATTKKTTKGAGARAAPKKAAPKRGRKRPAPESESDDDEPEPSEEEVDGEVDGDDGGAYEDEEDLDDTESINSDNLDDDYDVFPPEKGQKKTASPRKTNGKASPSTRKSTSPRKKRKTKKDEDDEAELDVELDDGQEIVGKVVQAPKSGRGTS